MYFRKYKSHDRCLPAMKKVSVGRTPKNRDDLVYTFDQRDGYKIYKVVDITEDGLLDCQEINKTPLVYERHRDLQFSRVGMFKYEGYRTDRKSLKVDDPAGKVVLVRDVLMTAPRNLLVER